MKVSTHSILGLPDIYNLLPEFVINAVTVKQFQHRLQQLVQTAANDNENDWTHLLSPRKTLHMHPLKKWFSWVGVDCKYKDMGSAGNVQAVDLANGSAGASSLCMRGWLHFGQ